MSRVPVFLMMTALYSLLILGLVVLAFAALRRARARAKARRRVVEQPNSHYTSPLVRQSETRHRWQDIALDRIHEINREEVVRLIARVEATSVDALRPREREFLDRMAELAGTSSPAEPRPKPSQMPGELRHRPA